MHVEIRKKSCRDTGSCWTGFSGSIDVSVACTWVLSVSYQHRWAARSRVPLQEKPKTTASVLLFFLLHTSHNPWPSASALWRGKPSHWPLLWRTEEIKEVKTNMINPQTLVCFFILDLSSRLLPSCAILEHTKCFQYTCSKVMIHINL